MHGTPGQAKILKSQANPELSNLVIRSSPASRSFLESLRILHLHNTVISWPDFSFGNLIELEIKVGEGEWTMALPELAAVLASCPRLHHLGLDGLAIKPFPSPNPRPILLNDLRVLRIAGFHSLHGEDGAGMFESVLALIRPGQNTMSVDISLAYVSKSPQQAIEAVCSFVNRSNVTTLRVQAYLISRFWKSPYFASQLGPLPRVQTLILDDWAFSDVVHCEDEDFEPKTYENPCPIDTNQVLWPQVQNLYIQGCILERDHLMRLISFHSIQTFCMRNCNDGSESRWGFGEETPGFRDYERLLLQIVPRVVYQPIPWGQWPFTMP
ncbi:hypothetical protein FS749_009032 [Ceratobasidium sp. UAMH 11750]|nr:hypothetical protein FS749_009032 [Ceratobasidium sp. UAMH 11750]